MAQPSCAATIVKRYASRVRRITRLLAFVGFALVACNEQPEPKTPQKEQGVPANSLSDARLHGEEKKAPPSETKEDPTQPYTTKMGEGASSSEPATKPGGKSNNKTSESSPPPSAPAGKGGPTVSREDCNRVMDKYLELEIGQNPQLKGVPPEVIDEAKKMARQQHGEAPCTATRSQFNCAMDARSTSAWQKCMK